MYNQEIANKLVEEFGNENFKIYCLMESKKNNLLHEESVEAEVYSEYDFEAQWWKNKYEELIKIENH